MLDRRQLIAAMALAGPGLLVARTLPAEPSGYAGYARSLLNSLPSGARFRPDLADYLSRLASAARRREGYEPLTASPLLEDAARAQTVEMLRGDFVGHYTAAGYRFNQRFVAFAGEGHGSFGENVARDRGPGDVGTAKADRLFRQWLGSAGHRRNLMSRHYRYVSTGALQYGRHLYAAQIFWEK